MFQATDERMLKKTKQNKAKEYYTSVYHSTTVPKARNNLVSEKWQINYKEKNT